MDKAKPIIKKVVIIALVIIVCYLLQTCIFPYLELAGVTPNLLIIVTASFGFMRGRREGMFIGFFCGLLQDCSMSTVYFGLYALIFLVIGYLNGLFRKMFFGDDIKLPLALIAGSDFVYSMAIYIISFLPRGRYNFFWYFKSVILPEIVYTILVSIILYFILYKLNGLIEKKDKRGRRGFV